ncbi:MAG: hypothetical protein JSS00_03920 [Proteobacteria bacterium]|nr:hypothetical protein [Pseudomonadota bacterium]
MRLADWIMRSATSNPPHGREQWAQAMRAEYALIKDGKLSWALGCWTTMLGWWVSAEMIYLVVLATAIVVLMSQLLFWAWVWIPHDLVRLGFYPPLLELFPACLLIALYRPRHAYLTAFAIFLLPNIYEYATMYTDGWFIAPHPERITIHDAPQIVGLMADLGGCLSGALLGRAIRDAIRRPASA